MPDLAVAPTDHAFEQPARAADAYQALIEEIGEDGASEVRSVFWNDTEMRLDLFGTLDLAEHRVRIAREAHSLKSAAGTFGYIRLAALAGQLERTAETLNQAGFRDLRDAMQSAYRAARALEPQD
jgi:HPt (histidine-containing phosphotransfer) domain-containing protein